MSHNIQEIPYNVSGKKYRIERNFRLEPKYNHELTESDPAIKSSTFLIKTKTYFST